MIGNEKHDSACGGRARAHRRGLTRIATGLARTARRTADLHTRRSRFVLLANVLVMFLFSLLIGFQLVSVSWGQSPPPADVQPTGHTSALTCTETVRRFIADLDSVMAESPRLISAYQAPLSRNLFYRQGFPGMPTTAPGSSVIDCNFDQLEELARHSKFLFEVGRPPRYAHYRIEFRNRLAKVYFSVDRNNGHIFGADVQWIKFYL